MRKLPKGIFTRANRPGFYCRIRRDGRDRWIKLGNARREAEAALKRVRGVDRFAPSLTVAQAARSWLSSYVATARCERFRRDTAARIGRYLVPALGMRRLSAVTADHVRALRLAVEANGLAPQTVRHVLADLRCMLRWAEESGLLDRSPFPRRVMPRIQERAPRRLDGLELDRLSVLPEPYAWCVRFLLGTGLRWSEATRAQASHVERGMLVVAHTKSGRLRRVPLSPELAREIAGRVGRLVPFSSSCSFNRTVRRLSGVEAFHVHRCRHTFACRWVDSGASLASLQEVLGHADLATTQIYARASEQATVAEAGRLWCNV